MKLSASLLALTLVSGVAYANPDDVQKVRASEADSMGLIEVGRKHFYNPVGEIQLERDMREWADSIGASYFMYRKRAVGVDRETQRASAVAYKAPGS